MSGGGFSEDRLRIALQTGRLAVWSADVDGALLSNPDLNRLLGFPAEVSPGWEEIEAKMPGELDRLRTAAWSALELGGRTFELEVQCERSPGDLRWFLVRGEVRLDPAGDPAGSAGVLMDITDLKRATDKVRLLAREIDHRSNNLLALIQGIVALADEPTVPELKTAILGRIQALGGAHKLLTEAHWTGADLHRLITDEVLAYSLADPLRISFEGPKVHLTPAEAQGLGMSFHELATNAAKYGALSVPGGHVAVSWASADGGGVRIRWAENGGPRLDGPPRRRGFGTTMIGRTLDGLGAKAHLQWPSTGLVCTIELPPRSDQS